MNANPTDGAGAPRRWLLIFRRNAKNAWINRLVPGRYKHVCAIGYVHECDTYLFFDAWIGGTTIQLGRGDYAKAMIAQWTQDSDVLRMDANSGKPGPWWPRWLCTSAVAHLVGIPGAVLPSALFRRCKAAGAVLIA